MRSTSGNLILLVEDDQLLRGAFRLLLEDAGYHVREAGSAAEALDTIAKVLPALIVLDLGLPDRPGLELARTLREDPETVETPIIALTGHAADADRFACFAAGCNHYFAKPVEPRILLRQVTVYLRSGL
jgi:CheY-like chemotaxis protein